MFEKSLKDFFKNPLMVLPLIISSLITIGDKNIDAKANNIQNLDINVISEFISKLITPTDIAIILLMIILSPYLCAWAYLMIKDKAKGNGINFTQNFKEARKYYLRVFLFDLAQGILSIVLIILAVVLGIALADVTGNSGAFIAIYALALTIGLVYLFVVLTAVSPIMVVEDEGIGGALSKTFNFGNNKFFLIFGTILLTSIVSGITGKILEFAHLGIIVSIVSAYFKVFIYVYIIYLYMDFTGKIENIETVEVDAADIIE